MSSPTSSSLPPAIGVGDLAANPLDTTKTLLGDRWLCRGGAAIMVGSTGIGKSSASMQQDILWSLGKEAFGIQPNGALKILTIQAENDSGDLTVMAKGVMDGLMLSQAERVQANGNAKYVHAVGETGEDFLDLVSKLLDEHKPDILRLDPLQAFLGGDINSAEAAAKFLRAGLNPLLNEHDCGLILVHHTPKPSRNSEKNRPDDFSYVGMGSSDISNWARAGLFIESSHERGVYRFLAIKRGGAIGWRDDLGEKEFARWFKHGANNWVWEPCAPSVKKPGQKIYTAECILLEVPESPKEGIMRSTLKNMVHQKQGIPMNKIGHLIEQLIDEGILLTSEGSTGKKGGRKPEILHRAHGKGGWYRDGDGKPDFKPSPVPEPHWIEREVVEGRPTNNQLMEHASLLSELSNGATPELARRAAAFGRS